MKRRLWDRRIPSFFAFLLLIISIGVTIFLVRGRVTLTGQATPDVNPQKVIISNITDTSFTVSFTTTAATRGGITIENSAELQTLFTDVRETENGAEYTTHYITISNLQPSTPYEFSILSNDSKFLLNEASYKVTTGPSIPDAPPETQTVSGALLLPDGTPAIGVLVYLTAKDTQILSALTNEQGTYEIPLNQIRTSNLESYATLENNTVLSIEAVTNNLTTTTELLYENSENVPPLTLSENYSFLNQVIEDDTESTTSALPIPSISGTVTEVQIITPQEDQTLIDTRPSFRGTGPPNQEVEITIQSDPITATVQTNSSGNWTFRPPTALPPGDHTITIRVRDSLGILRTVTQSFTVLPPGSQIAQAATPSASLTPTRRPSVTRAPSIPVSPSPTVGLTITPSATPTATFTPSPSPSPTPTTPITAIPTVAQPGTPASIVLTGVSLFFIVTGALLFFIIA